MRQVIIIENRNHRQEEYLTSESLEKLKKIDGVCNPTPGDDSCDVFKRIKDKDFSILEQYGLIAIHESFIKEADIRDEFVKYIMDKKNDLILFSGGNTQMTFHKYNGGNLLSLSPEIFYRAEFLLPFMQEYTGEENKPHLLELVYGKHYKLSFLLQYQRILWQNNEKGERDAKMILEVIRPNIEEELNDSNNLLAQSFARCVYNDKMPFDRWWMREEYDNNEKPEQKKNIIRRLIEKEYVAL